MTERTKKIIRFIEAFVVLAIWPLFIGHALAAQIINGKASFCPAGKYINKFDLIIERKSRGWDKFHRTQKRK